MTYEFTSSKEALADAACQQDGVLFVLKDFEDGTGCENSDYMELMRAKKWFCGATALIQSLSRKEVCQHPDSISCCCFNVQLFCFFICTGDY